MQNEITELRNQVRMLKRIVCLVCCLFASSMFAGCEEKSAPQTQSPTPQAPTASPTPQLEQSANATSTEDNATSTEDTATQFSPIAIIIPVLSKRNLMSKDWSNGKNFVWFNVALHPKNLKKPTSAVKGVIEFADQFGAVKLTLDEMIINHPLQPNVVYHIDGSGISRTCGYSVKEYASHGGEWWVQNRELEEMLVWFRVISIIYEDGERQNF